LGGEYNRGDRDRLDQMDASHLDRRPGEDVKGQMKKRPRQSNRRNKSKRLGSARQRSSGKLPSATPEAPTASRPREPLESVPDRARGEAWHLTVIGLALASLIALAYRRLLFLDETFVERDALRLTLPSREFLVQTLQAWRIPEWFDGVGFGAPFAANPVHEVFAPLGWTMALLPTSLGFDIYNLLHVLIGALGVAALSRRLGAGTAASVVAGASLGLGGYVTSMLPNGLVPALAWTPWVAWAADRLAGEASKTGDGTGSAAHWRAGAIFAAIFALQLFAGEPASILIAVLVALIVVAVRAKRPLYATGTLLLAAIGALLLAALAIVPGLFLLSDSARGAGLDKGGLEWSLHPARLLELGWPMAYGSQVGDGWYAGLLFREGPGDPCWSFSLFLGLPILLSAVVAWREPHVRRLLLASLPFLVVAAGPLTPLYSVLQRAFFPVQLVNFPEKFVYGALLLWVAAAGVGFTRVIGEGVSRRMRLLALVATAALALGVSLIGISRTPLTEMLAQRAAEWHYLFRAEAGVAAAIRGGWIATVGGGLFVLALALRSRSRRWASGLAIFSALGPLVWAAGVTTPFAPRSVVAETPTILRPLTPSAATSGTPRPRIIRVDPLRGSGPFARGEDVAREYHESIDTNIASRFGIAVLPGFTPGESVRTRRFGREVFPRMDKRSFVRLLGVQWLAAQDPENLNIPFEVIARADNGWALLSTGRVRPRAFVASRWRSADAPDRALETLTAPGREDDPDTVVIVGAKPETQQASGPLSPCGVQLPRPEEVLLDCASPTGGYAVLLDEWAKGWTATVDGRDVEVQLAEGLFRAVAVDPGQHQIVFRYRTPGLRSGAAISLACWLAWVLLMIRCRPVAVRG
jgi:hypothetical protein